MTEGKRKELNESWYLIPGLFYSLGKVAEVANYGAYRAGPDGEGYGVDNWKDLKPTGTKCPLNHAIRHLAKATTFKIGDPEREWQLAKAAWNVLAQIVLESAFIPEDGPRTTSFVEQEFPVTDAPLPPLPSNGGDASVSELKDSLRWWDNESSPEREYIPEDNKCVEGSTTPQSERFPPWHPENRSRNAPLLPDGTQRVWPIDYPKNNQPTACD